MAMGILFGAVVFQMKKGENPMSPFARRQALIQRQLPAARELFARHDLEQSGIDALAPLIAHFEIRVPFIGAFSAGKSSLLNTLLGENLLATAVTPETAVPTELAYGPQRQFLGRLPDGRQWPLNEQALIDNDLAALRPTGWVEAKLPHPALAARPRLVLVDMPGWDSGVAAHERIIDDYAGRSLAYAVVTSAEEGALRENLRRALLELGIAQLPVVLVISKADKRPPEDVQAVAERLRADVVSLMGHEPLAVAITSSRKKNVAALEAALDVLEARAEEIYENRVVDVWRRHLEWAIQQLTVLVNAENKDIPRLEAEIEQLEQELRDFDLQLQKETAALRAQIGPILGTIRLRVENALAGRVDALAERVLAGIDITDEILGTARLVVSEAVRQEFEPAWQRYLVRLDDALPDRLELDLALDLGHASDAHAGSEKRGKSIGALIGGLLFAIPIPHAKILAPLAPILGAIFDLFKDSKREQIEAARQREYARSRVRDALLDASRQIEGRLRPLLEERLEQALAQVQDKIAAECAAKKSRQETLIAARKQGEKEAAALRQRAQADIDRLDAMLAELANASSREQPVQPRP